MQFRNLQKSLIWKGFSLPETYRNSVKLGGRFMDDPRGLATYKKGPRGTPKAPQVAAPPCAQTLAAPLLLPPVPAWRSPAGFLLHHHHHAVVLLGFHGDLLHPLPARPGRGSSTSTTVRVTEGGGAARLQCQIDRLQGS